MVSDLAETWRALVTADHDIGRAYAMHLVERVKGLVLDVLDEDAAVGTYYWGRRRGGVVRPRKEWLSIPVTPIVDAQVHALALSLRRERDLGSAGGRAVAQPRVLGGLVVCGRCGASCQLETSCKTIDGNRYRYCYYSCRTYCRGA